MRTACGPVSAGPLPAVLGTKLLPKLDGEQEAAASVEGMAFPIMLERAEGAMRGMEVFPIERGTEQEE
jgi:hypothetical protein